MSKQSGKTAMNVRVLLLTAVFALMCAAVILAGVHAYRVVAKRTQKISDQRTAIGYVMNRIYAAQSLRIETMTIDENAYCVLIMEEEIDGKAYETRLFCADEALREQFCSAEIPLSSAVDGTELAQLHALEAWRDGNLLTLRFIHKDGMQTQMNVMCPQEGNAT